MNSEVPAQRPSSRASDEVFDSMSFAKTLEGTETIPLVDAALSQSTYLRSALLATRFTETLSFLAILSISLSISVSIRRVLVVVRGSRP